ncbi:MAG: anchored repeat-type ABC transporter ATP-binding subunit [Actinomycetaceae bacterium]|nr:anchored repeat-type ABC transporter ATP-binding subunit [Arcanobacterium sp.]MDD7504762.1 anchored repeat-type ABC transporter ATP-binding subunit [Actinomycetaceae bacterium]MDY6143567.1 anchored repeat-type ABC transporter ATP-binding subunit [Arcanobacterium sp.]
MTVPPEIVPPARESLAVQGTPTSTGSLTQSVLAGRPGTAHEQYNPHDLHDSHGSHGQQDPCDQDDPSVAVTNLHVSLGGRHVLHEIDFSLMSGELVGLLGPNGAGKTTLMRAILGLIPIDSGRIVVDGRSDVKARRTGVGYVPQRHDVDWALPLTVYDAVLSGRVRTRRWGRVTRQDHELCASALGRVRMASLAQRPVGELSGGQRQRVLIARALVKQPAVLLLDEPFTGLDMPTQEILIELFRSLACEGETLLMSTHDLPSAQATCDRLILLREQIYADGSPHDLRDAEPWSATFQVHPNSPLLAGLGLSGAGVHGVGMAQEQLNQDRLTQDRVNQVEQHHVEGASC